MSMRRDALGGHHGARHHHFPGPHAGPEGPRRRGRGRASRGDVRAAVLSLLAEEPMHGYQIMQTIADRSGGRWTPSPGAIYPTISQLEDEGLVTVADSAGRRLATLTEAGRQVVADGRETWNDPFGAAGGGRPGGDIRALVQQVHGAAREVARTGTEAQLRAAAKILGEARRRLYTLLAEGGPGPECDPDRPA